MTAPTMHPVLHSDVFTGYESTVYREKLPGGGQWINVLA